MDKHKLVNIIIKDLEEIKNLSEEVATSQDNTSLVIELALNRARLLCQEIEVLRELVGNSVSKQIEPEEDSFDEEKEEENISVINFPDPELEILHFEEREMPENKELMEEEDLEEEEIEDEILDEEDLTEEEMNDLEEGEIKIADEELEEEDLTVLEEEDNEDGEQDEETDLDEEEDDEDDLTETENEDSEEDDSDLEELDEETDLDEEDEEEDQLQKTNIQVTELKNGPQPGIREIHIDELDDEDDLESVHFSHLQGSSARQPMREIPKPENTESGKTMVGETFQKERSLNDTIGENKSESKLTNGPITSLRAAIGLNDRFIFIREIFDNNSEKYNTIIDKLDKMEHIQEAVEYLKANLSMQKNEASMKFVDLLKRRFTK